MNLSSTLTHALTIVSEARRRLLAITRAELQIEKKADNTFVTRADKETELFIREQLQTLFPDHGILGEEFPTVASRTPYTWVIDPIDGTHSFRHGIPLYGTMLCLMENDTPIVAVIDLPALGRQYGGARGLGTTCNGQPVHLRDLAPGELLEDEVIATGERKQFVDCGKSPLFDDLIQQHPHVRTYCDCFGHALAIEGTVGAMVDYGIRIWDCMASVLLVQEAGGKAVCTGTHRKDGAMRYDWIFGKPAVVDWVCKQVGFAD